MKTGKNTNYFLNLEKRNFLRKKISKLKLSNGEETEDPKEILEEEKSFYKKLYTSKNVDPENSEFDIFFNNNLLKPLTGGIQLFYTAVVQLFSTNALTDVTKVELVQLLVTLKDIVVTYNKKNKV